MAANVVAYPDIALEKFTGLDPSEDAQEFFSLIQRKIQFSLGTRDPADADLQAAYDARQKALFGSVLRGPAAQWFETLAPGLAWNEVRNQFITRFTDAKDKYRKRIEVESIKRQPDELIKSYTHRVTKAVEKGWPDPDFNNDQRNAKCMEYFVRGLTPPTLKQKAHQRLIENPATTWQQLQDHVATKDLSFSVSSEFTGTASSSIDNKIEIEGLKNQLTEIANLMKDHKINATYNNDNPRFKQNQTRFCKFCKRSGHTIAFCFKYKDFKNENRNPPQQREKFTDNYKRSRSHSPGQQNYKITNQTIMTIKILGTDIEIVITKINPIIKTTLGQTTDIDHRTHQTLQTIIDHLLTITDHRNDKITIETTHTEITIGKIVGIDKATVLQDQIIDIVIGVETMTGIGHLLDKTIILIQEITVKGEALEFTLPVKLLETITIMRTTTTSI